MTPPARTLARLALLLVAGPLVSLVSAQFPDSPRQQVWKQHDMSRPKPPVVEPAPTSVITAQPPKDAVILFDGTTLDEWQDAQGRPAPWKISQGRMEVVPSTGVIKTKRKFGDIQLHLEFATPNPPHGTSQDRGNSGIFLMDRYEIQVIDSYKADTYADGQAAAIYGQYPPLANASRPPGEWQSFDIAFRRPRFDHDGKVVEPARVTVIHNGILVQNNEELFGLTSNTRWRPYDNHADKEPIRIQDHRHPVHFRNIWVRELAARPEPSAEYARGPKIVSLSPAELDPFIGEYLDKSNPRARPMRVTRDRGRLLLKMPNRSIPLILEPTSPLEFEMPYTDSHFTIKREPDGRVLGATFVVADGQPHFLTRTGP